MLEKLIEIIAANSDGVDPSSITVDTDFISDLEFTSLDIVNCISEAEDAFGKEIPEDQLENIRTVGDILDLLK